MRSFYDSIFFNVPPLRFPEFTGEWENTSLGKIGKTFNGLTGKSGSDFGQGFPYITYKSIFDNSKIDISRVEYVEITDVERKKETQNKVQYGDVFFTTSSETPDEVGMSSVLLDEVKDCYLNSFCFGYRLNSLSKTVPEYMRFYLRSQTIRKKMFVLAQGSTRFNISKSEVMGMSINIPEIEEQRKIANLLTLLDDRIATQNKIIEKLQSLIEGLGRSCIAPKKNGGKWVTLKDICHITTGKLDASAMVKGGKYPFYTCAETPFAINEYAFDTEALLISGNGANLGYINYYKGRFNAYQRTYVLDAFTENIQYVKCVLKVVLPKRISIEKSTSNTPYIVMSTLADMKIFLPTEIYQNRVANLMYGLETKLHQQTTILINYHHLKSYLLQQMFI